MKTKLLSFLAICLILVLSAEAQPLVKSGTFITDTPFSSDQTIGVTRLLDIPAQDSTLQPGIDTSVWHYIVLTKAADRSGKIYLDGQLVADGIFLDVGYSFSSLYIACSYYTSWRRFFNGWIDEMRVSNTIRSVTEISNAYLSDQPFSADANTIGLWHFDEASGTSFSNDVGGNGVLYNGASFATGKFGNAVYFDGIDDRGNCNLNPPENNITVELWAKLDGFNHGTDIIQLYGMYNTHISCDTLMQGAAYVWSDGSTGGSMTTDLSADTQIWVSDGNSTDTLYISRSPNSVPDTVYIGTDVPDEDLVYYYPFDGNADDFGSRNMDGVLNGAVLTTDRNGIADQAYQFDGVDDFIEIPEGLAFTNDFTISFWAYSETVTGSGTILCDGSSSAGGNDFLINFRGNEIGIRADKSGGSLNHEYSSPASLTGLSLVNQWVHVAWVMQPGYSKIYLDGTEIAHIDQAGSNEGYHDSLSYIGARNVWDNPDNFYKGKLDDLKIYARGLEPEQIMSLYNGSGLTKIHYDTIIEIVYDTVTQTRLDLQYLRFESYYSEDAGQVNVYEIEGYHQSANIALNKATFTNSCEGGGVDCGGPAVDGDGFSRWSSDRNDAGPDLDNPHFIVVDLGQEYNLDSIVLNIEGFDHWDQNFRFYGSPDSIDWFLIGEGEGITGIFTYDSYVSNQVIQHDTVIVEVYDTIYESTPAFQYPVYREGDIKYVKFESFYSQDRNQVNVYELQAFDEGLNVALNKPSFANSTPQGSYSAVDGSDNSRWSANRYDVGPDFANPHFIIVDLQESYLLDSIYLNIKGFDSWNQTFNVLVSNDSSKWYLIDSEVDTTGIFTYPLRTWNIITVHDTVRTTIENHISVTDTLIIDAVLTGITGPDNINTLKVYPNPARDFLYINTGDYARMNGYKLKIISQLGSVVFETNVEDPLYQVNLSSWTGTGLYFIQLIDSGDMIIDIRKIILQ